MTNKPPLNQFPLAQNAEHFDTAKELTSGSRTELLHARFKDGRPRTVRVIPAKRQQSINGDNAAARPDSAIWHLLVEIQERTGPTWAIRTDVVPWLGKALLVAGSEVRIFATLVAGTVSEGETSGVRPYAVVNTTVRDGAPIRFDSQVETLLTQSVVGDLVDIPTLSLYWRPRYIRHSATAQFAFADAHENTLNTAPGLYAITNSSTASTNDLFWLPIPLGAAKVACYDSGTSAEEGPHGVAFWGQI